MSESNQLAVDKTKLKNMKSFLMQGAESMRLILQDTMDPEELVRYALNAAQNNPTLFLCQPTSVALSLMNASVLGLKPNGYDGHLVPYNQYNKEKQCKEWICQFIPDYKGYTKLMHQAPELQSVSAGAVRKNDEFDFEFGTKAFLRHKPPVEGERGDLIAAWALYRLKDGSSDFVVLTQSEVLKHKNASPSTGGRNPDKSPWNSWEDAMWSKTAIRILRKFAPLGPGVEKACAYEDAMMVGDLPTNHVFGADADGPLITLDLDPATEPEQPASNSKRLADKMQAETIPVPPMNEPERELVRETNPATKQEPARATQAPTKPLAEKPLYQFMKKAIETQDRDALLRFRELAEASMTAGIIDQALCNVFCEQASNALEEMRVPN